jgi:GNAT superfamily N-acetyltransferase
MTEEEIPDYNLFMMCEHLNERALSALPESYYFRTCNANELHIWKALPFNTETVPAEYQQLMNQFVADTYAGDMQTFLNSTIFVCNGQNKPIATCSYWKAYGKFNTIQWFKTKTQYEGKGIGRALLSKVMKTFAQTDYPIYLHTQPSSFKAVKLYADFGFQLLKGGQIGHRCNELEQSLPILRQFIPLSDFEQITITNTPEHFIKVMENETTVQF